MSNLTGIAGSFADVWNSITKVASLLDQANRLMGSLIQGAPSEMAPSEGTKRGNGKGRSAVNEIQTVIPSSYVVPSRKQGGTKSRRPRKARKTLTATAEEIKRACEEYQDINKVAKYFDVSAGQLRNRMNDEKISMREIKKDAKRRGQETGIPLVMTS